MKLILTVMDQRLRQLHIVMMTLHYISITMVVNHINYLKEVRMFQLK